MSEGVGAKTEVRGVELRDVTQLPEVTPYRCDRARRTVIRERRGFSGKTQRGLFLRLACKFC